MLAPQRREQAGRRREALAGLPRHREQAVVPGAPRGELRRRRRALGFCQGRLRERLDRRFKLPAEPAGRYGPGRDRRRNAREAAERGSAGVGAGGGKGVRGLDRGAGDVSAHVQVQAGHESVQRRRRRRRRRRGRRRRQGEQEGGEEEASARVVRSNPVAGLGHNPALVRPVRAGAVGPQAGSIEIFNRRQGAATREAAGGAAGAQAPDGLSGDGVAAQVHAGEPRRGRRRVTVRGTKDVFVQARQRRRRRRQLALCPRRGRFPRRRRRVPGLDRA